MKKLITATLIGMICFQSCTKESNILPVLNGVQKNESVTTNNKEKSTTTLLIDNTNTEEMKPLKFIRCGTDVPKTTTKGSNHTPPVVVVP